MRRRTQTVGMQLALEFSNFSLAKKAAGISSLVMRLPGEMGQTIVASRSFGDISGDFSRPGRIRITWAAHPGSGIARNSLLLLGQQGLGCCQMQRKFRTNMARPFQRQTVSPNPPQTHTTRLARNRNGRHTYRYRPISSIARSRAHVMI